VTIIDACTTPASTDGDGIPPLFDNCPDRWNAGQEDTDGDGIGDVCDLPDEVSLAPGDLGKGTPVVWTGCAGATVLLEILGLVFAMDEVEPGVYEKVLFEAQFPEGFYGVIVDSECPNPSQSERVVFGGELVYLDPSGLIMNQIGQALSGATVTLYFSPTVLTDPSDPGFTFVHNDSSIMSEATRQNPVTTDSTGFYKWDTVPGWYVVAATVPGCMNPDGSGFEVRSAVLPVPPEQFNIDLVFNCTSLPTCDGQTVTIAALAGTPTVGTSGDDVILGSAGDDVIDGGAGNDIVCAGDGNDVVTGGDGNDRLLGDGGNDVLRGGPGVDVVNGGLGNDRVLGGIGNDTLIGDAGNDFLGGFGGDDDISGGDGNDTVFGGFGSDTISGGPGNDKINGLIGDDVIAGGAGDDVLSGDRGNDDLMGNAGNDILRGGNASDILHGGAGDDDISGGKADDQLIGGAGTDSCKGNTEFVADTAATCEVIFGVP